MRTEGGGGGAYIFSEGGRKDGELLGVDRIWKRLGSDSGILGKSGRF